MVLHRSIVTVIAALVELPSGVVALRDLRHHLPVDGKVSNEPDVDRDDDLWSELEAVDGDDGFLIDMDDEARDDEESEWPEHDWKNKIPYRKNNPDGRKQEPKWFPDYGECKQDISSPINIVKDDLHFTQGPPIHDAMEVTELEGRAVRNNGHGLHITGPFGQISLPDGDYVARNIHFHFPSEHAIDGQLADGEMGILHVKYDDHDKPMEYAMVSVLIQDAVRFSRDRKIDDAIAEEIRFFRGLGLGSRKLPMVNASKQIRDPVDLSVFKHRVFSGRFYHYTGSLTTPPCSPNVHWYIMELVSPMMSYMLKNTKRVLHGENSRPTRPLRGRKVVVNELTVEGEVWHMEDEEDARRVKSTHR